MTTVAPERLAAYRAGTFATAPGARLRKADDAVAYVNRLGFCFFWPIKGVLLPSLWVAVAGDRPVADEHDDPGHITWGWKDDLLGKRLWFYTRLLHRKNSMVSLETIPFFYALTPNFGSPGEDYLIQYEQGLLTLEARLLFEALLREGPLDTLSLRRAAHLTGAGSDTRYNRALEQLQVDLRVLPVGISRAGAWHYAHIYDLVHRHFPEIPEQSRLITENQARMHLLHRYIGCVGSAHFSDIGRVFSWKREEIQTTAERLVKTGTFVMAAQNPGSAEDCLTLHSLV